ncbi:MAG: DUF697 domain-containing protein [Wenzhouxiangella sp.]|nr:MAG: DUF697 domain-containing protein [Wenzhouxiangella sp.]
MKALRRHLISPSVAPEEIDRAVARAVDRMALPVIWLLGTAQSGKTSIVRALTGAADAEIGNGFQPCTRTARRYDFPQAAPMVRFLDTRGLGEVSYDPDEDLAVCEAQSHQVLAVLKVSDTRPTEVLEVLRRVRKRHPDWPLIIAQTCLHDAYASIEQGHPLPYPFDRDDWNLHVDADLVRLIRAQREELADLPGSGPVWWVPIDFTRPEDGYEPVDYGLAALWDALECSTLAGLRARIVAAPEVHDAIQRAAHPQIMGYSLATAALGAIPLVDLAAVPAVQARLLHVLASIYGVGWTRRSAAEFLALLGTGVAVGYGTRLAGRSLAKLIPGWGQTAGAAWAAAASGATTYALGKSACLYLQARRDGLTIDPEPLRKEFTEALRQGRRLIGGRRPPSP